MTLFPNDLEEIQKAVNATAARTRNLWIAFLTLGTYLVIAVGSVTHVDLFLEKPITLPVLNVDLPLTGFFLVAPVFFWIYHFYLLLQLAALARRVRDYNGLLEASGISEEDQDYLRRRLDPFIFVQFLAGARDERMGGNDWMVRIVAFLTIGLGPVLLFLQIQLSFLPYQHELLTWLHRGLLCLDLLLLGWIAPKIVEVAPIERMHLWAYGTGITSSFVVCLSWFILTFPGETVHVHDRTPVIANLRALFFATTINDVKGVPNGLFANVIVVSDQDFVDDEQLAKRIQILRNRDEAKEIVVGDIVVNSFRGRNLNGAVLDRADLRYSDFTGAELNGASLTEAKLDHSLFGCAPKDRDRDTGDFSEHNVRCAELNEASLIEAKLNRSVFGCAPHKPGDRGKHFVSRSNNRCAELNNALLNSADLKGATLDGAQLQHASFRAAQLQSASLKGAQLQGARFARAKLQDSSFNEAKLSGASFYWAELQSASLQGAKLPGANLRSAGLQGANLNEAQFQGAVLDSAQLQGASLEGAQLQGALLDFAQFQGASLSGAFVWRARSDYWPEPDLADFYGLQRDASWADWIGSRDEKKSPKDAFSVFMKQITTPISDQKLKDRIIERISILNPEKDDPKSRIDLFRSQSEPLVSPDYVERIGDLGCRKLPLSAVPHIARGLIRNGRVAAAGEHAVEIAKRFKDPENCPGAVGLTDEDYAALDRIVSANAPKLETQPAVTSQ